MGEVKKKLFQNTVYHCLSSMELKFWHLMECCICIFFFRTLFAQYLGQKIEKEQMLEVKSGQSKNPTYLQNGERYINLTTKVN
jgi:hypothetical protein